MHTVYYMITEKCSHCEHEWIRRTEDIPVKCPKCHRRYYGRKN